MAFARTEAPEALRLSRLGGILAIVGMALFAAGMATVWAVAGDNVEVGWAFALAMTGIAVDVVAAGFLIAAWRRERAWQSAP